MTRPFLAVDAWVRRFASPENFGLALLALGCLAIAWLAESFGDVPRLMVAGVSLLAIAVLLRVGWARLLGPVALYELVHTTRRSRFILYRPYAYFVMILLALCHCVWAAVRND